MANHSRPSEITRILQQADDKRQHEDLRHEHKKSTNAAEQCVRRKIAQHTLWQKREHPDSHPNDR